MKILFGSDHAGYELKNKLMQYVREKGYEVTDKGCFGTESVDYPLYGYLVGKEVAGSEDTLGVVVCGTGIGISMAAGKVKGIRAFACSDPYSAGKAREHNNANVIGIGARVVGDELAKAILDSFLNTSFAGGRHARRVDMISEIDSSQSLAAERNE